MQDPGHSHAAKFDHGVRAFAWATGLNLAFAIVEAFYGWKTDSLALLSDALHNFGDVLGLVMALAAGLLARREATRRHTYGWQRATLLSPLINSLLLVGLSGALVFSAIQRFRNPVEIPGVTIMIVAGIGIAVNLGSALFVKGGHDHHGHGHEDLNRKGAYLHLLADAAVSLATVITGFGVWKFGWQWLDPATTLLVTVFIFASTYGLLRDSWNATMDAVPRHLDPAEVAAFIDANPNIISHHDLHIWSLGTETVALTAHVRTIEQVHPDTVISSLQTGLREKFGIGHITVQIENATVCMNPDCLQHHSH